MKRTVLYLLLIIALSGGCKYIGKGDATSGSGVMKTEQRSIPAFTALDIHGAYEVEITAQKEQRVEIEGDDNLLLLIKTEVKGNVLTVGNDQGITTRGKLRLRISVPKLDGITTSGASDINVTGVKGDAFKIDSSGAGNFKIAGETKTLEIKVSGAGELDAKDLRAEKVNINSSGAANADVYASEELHINASGAGSVNYYGDPKTVTKDSSGVASINKK